MDGGLDQALRGLHGHAQCVAVHRGDCLQNKVDCFCSILFAQLTSNQQALEMLCVYGLYKLIKKDIF